MLNDYVDRELLKRERIVIENPDWLVVVPYWAAWPFETMLISRNNNKRIDDLTETQVNNLAAVIKELTTKYDNLFKCSFPYSMGWHGKQHSSHLSTQITELCLWSFRRRTNWANVIERCIALDSACIVLSAIASVGLRSQIHGWL